MLSDSAVLGGMRGVSTFLFTPLRERRGPGTVGGGGEKVHNFSDQRKILSIDIPGTWS